MKCLECGKRFENKDDEDCFCSDVCYIKNSGIPMPWHGLVAMELEEKFLLKEEMEREKE